VDAAIHRRLPARRDRADTELARGARESRGHRLSGCDEHARGAQYDHPARYRIHGEDRQGGRDQAGIAMAGKLKLSMMIGSYEILPALKARAAHTKGIELLGAYYLGTRLTDAKLAPGLDRDFEATAAD